MNMELGEGARAVFDAMREGITIIDAQGNIVFGNRAYREFLNREAGGDIGPIEGYRLRDLRPGARLPDVLEAGRPICHLTRKEVADFYFVNMYPIYQDGALVGGVSVVTFLEDAYQAREELEAMERRSRQVLTSINKANGARYTFEDIVAVCPASVQVKKMARRIAATDATVLLASESGTGKELYAQAIHNASPRQDEVFVAINCANFNPNMLEAELFGYAEGAFTGAKKGGKLGLFEAANKGTLFLDEVSEMDPALQSKLLRALQERRIRPVGALKEIDVDVRVIAASNADLDQYVREGKFRRDLYYRLSTVPICIPPLRERREDIPQLADSLLEDLSRKLKRRVTISGEALDILLAHDWPGNVRELRNVLEFSAYLSDNGVIVRDSLPESLVRPALEREAVPLAQRVRQFERSEIGRLLLRYGSDLAGKKRAAKELGISLATLYNKLGENGSKNQE